MIFNVPKFKVYHFIPWNSDKNIGVSYNELMQLISVNDWACFLDGDAVHTTPFFGKRIEQTIEANPNFDLFTCYTNRVHCYYQIAPNVDVKSNDQNYHRDFGESLWKNNKTSVMDVTNLEPLSGVLILIKKSSWEKVGGFYNKKMLGVDNDIHKKIKSSGGKIGLMQGIYVQHWYRGGDKKNNSHLL